MNHEPKAFVCVGEGQHKYQVGRDVKNLLSASTPIHHMIDVMVIYSMRPSVRQVLKQVGLVFQVKMGRSPRGGETNDARKVAMYAVKGICDLTLTETAREFDVTSYGTIG